MIHGILVLVTIALWLALAGAVRYALAALAPRPRTRPVRTARPGGPPLIPASGAGRARGVPVADVDAMHATRNGLLARPGSAGLPAIDPGVLAHLRRRMAGLPAHQRSTVPAAGWALAPVLYGRGACPYPADTLTDMPAVEDRPRIHPLYREWERKQAARRRLI